VVSPVAGLVRLGRIGACRLAVLLILLLADAPRAQVVLRQIYGGGGNVYERDFVELFNRGTSPVSLSGWSIQYASANGSGLFSGGAPSLLSGTLQPGQSMLVGLAASASGGPLPTPLLSGNPATNLASTSGKVALVRSADGLACNGGSTPCGPAQHDQILDLVGYGAADFFEGTSAAPAASGTTALLRTGGGCTDTYANSVDFVAGPPFPRTSTSTRTPCTPNTAIELSLSTAFASEAARTVLSVTATAEAPVAADQSVLLAIGGAGVTEDDYVVGDTTLDLPAGETRASTSLAVVDDLALEGSEQVSLTLAQPSAGLRPGAFIHRTLTLADNDGCGLAATAIHAVQGSGIGTPLAGSVVTVEGIVVGRVLGSAADSLQGFFLQEEDVDSDLDSATSEGLFVAEGSGGLAAGIAVRDRVRVTGTARERSGRTALESLTSVELCKSGEPLPKAASMILPVPAVPAADLAAATAAIDAYYEAFESMRVLFPFSLTVADSFELAREGVLVLDQGGRIQTFTDGSLPSPTGFVGHQIEVARRRILLDDSDDHPDSALVNLRPLPYPTPGLGIANRFRAGDRITSLTGILDGSSLSASGSEGWRIRPVHEASSYVFASENPRPIGPPLVGGSLELASFNVANYFATLDTTPSNSSGPCGPSGTLDCRGADSAAELARQTEKLVAALCRLDPDVVGLMEMENDAGAATIGLIGAANAVPGCGPFAFVDTGPIGSDAIRIALVYKPASVEAMGASAILDASVDPRFDDRRSRPVLAQTLREIATGRRFTIAVAHLKSKGSSCAFLGDADTGDGQGNCNATRRSAAAALVDWLASDPTASGDPDFLIFGDLNSYSREDPVRAILAGADDAAGTADDFIDLVRRHSGPAAHSYIFDGQTGRLDHALASATLAAQVTGAALWPINADEPRAFDYDDPIADPGEAPFEAKPSALPLYAPDELRTSDHDPLVIGLPEPGRYTGLAVGVLAVSMGRPRRRFSRNRDEARRRDQRQLVGRDEPGRSRDDSADRIDRRVCRCDTEIRQVRGVVDREARAYARDAVDLDDVALLGRPVRLHRVPEPPAQSELDHGLALHSPRPDALETTDGALADLHVTEVEVLRRGTELDVEADLVELDLERARHHLDRIEKDEHASPRPLVEAGGFGRRSKADVEPGLGRGVGGRIDGFENRYPIDPPADRRRDEPQDIREPRIDARPVQRDAPLPSSRVESAHVRLAVGLSGDEVGRRDDVHARLEEPNHVVYDPLQRHVEDAVGAQGENRVEVVRRRDPELSQATEIADIRPDLVIAPGITADELEVGMIDDGLHGAAADEARRPLHDAQLHGAISPGRCSSFS